MIKRFGIAPNVLITLLLIVSVLSGMGRMSLAGDPVGKRIADFWTRVDAMQPSDRLSSSDLGQWALNVIERDPTAGITVADFRVATAGMQAAMDRAGHVSVPAPSPSPTSNPAAIVVKVGTSVTYSDGWKITMIRTEPQAAGRFGTPSAGMQFVAILVRYDNATPAQASFNMYDWKMQDSGGVRRSGSLLFGDRTDSLNSGQLAPGSFVQGSVVFEAPVGDARLSVIYEDYGYKLATWQLY